MGVPGSPTYRCRMTNSPSEQYWEQPTFTEPAPPPVTGQVLSGAMVPGATRVEVAPPSHEEATLRTIRRLIWPVALVLAIAGGHWVPLLVLAIVVSAILRRRVWALASQRFVMRSVPSGGPGADLR